MELYTVFSVPVELYTVLSDAKSPGQKPGQRSGQKSARIRNELSPNLVKQKNGPRDELEMSSGYIRSGSLFSGPWMPIFWIVDFKIPALRRK